MRQKESAVFTSSVALNISLTSLVDTRNAGWVARLALPAQTDAGMLDRIGDVVSGAGGTLFAATVNAVSDPGPGAGRDVVVRLTPVSR